MVGQRVSRKKSEQMDDQVRNYGDFFPEKSENLFSRESVNAHPQWGSRTLGRGIFLPSTLSMRLLD